MLLHPTVPEALTLAPGSCQLFHPEPVPCLIHSPNKRSDGPSKISSLQPGESRRRLTACLAAGVPAEERSFLH